MRSCLWELRDNTNLFAYPQHWFCCLICYSKSDSQTSGKKFIQWSLQLSLDLLRIHFQRFQIVNLQVSIVLHYSIKNTAIKSSNVNGLWPRGFEWVDKDEIYARFICSGFKVNFMFLPEGSGNLINFVVCLPYPSSFHPRESVSGHLLLERLRQLFRTIDAANLLACMSIDCGAMRTTEVVLSIWRGIMKDSTWPSAIMSDEGNCTSWRVVMLTQVCTVRKQDRDIDRSTCKLHLHIYCSL